MAGYSKTPLPQKLGVTRDSRAVVVNAPGTYEQLIGFPVQNNLVSNMDFIHFFTKDRKELEEIFEKLKKSITQNGMIWISWPKGKSGVATDLSENIIRDLGLKMGLVDVKVAAVDETWSGVKFVIPLKDRV